MFRRLLTSTLLASYGLAAMCGYGLHELTGCEHGHPHVCERDHSPEVEADALSCCHHHHAKAEERSRNEQSHPSVGVPDHDCLLCDFLATAQLSAPPRPLDVRRQPSRNLIVPRSDDPLGGRLLTAHARAPPQFEMG